MVSHGETDGFHKVGNQKPNIQDNKANNHEDKPNIQDNKACLTLF